MKHMLRIIVTAAVLLSSVSIISAQTSDYFLSYPGGFTEAHYRITTSDLANPIELGWVIEPVGENELSVTTTNRVTAERNDLELGVLNGIAQAQLIIQSESVRALLENPRSLTPNSAFIVPGGAQFTTAERDTILGVEIICGVLTSQDDPDERTILGITEDPTLPFPPFIRLEETSTESGEASALPVCQSLNPILNSNPNQFSESFTLQLTEFERRE